MEIFSAENNEGPIIKENFIKNILLEIPELETCKILISALEEIFKDLEIDVKILAKSKTHLNNSSPHQIKDKIQSHKKTFVDFFKNKNTNQNQLGFSSQNSQNFNINPHLQNNSRRKTSFDLSENSLDKNNKEEKNNFTIDKYFKPVDKKLSYNKLNFIERKKEINRNFIHSSNRQANNIITSSIINKIRDNSNNNSNHIVNNNINTYSSSLKDYENFKTKNSVKSCHSEEVERMSVNSNSKKNSLIIDNATQNSNLFNTEYSKISHESNLRRINISNSVTTPCHGYNSFNPFISSAKSTSFSQNSFVVSQFSNNLNQNNITSKSFKYQTPGENSSHISDVSNNTSQFLGSSINLSSSLIKQNSRSMGINSLLANKIISIPKTRKNSDVNFKTFPSNTSSSKKRKKEKMMFLQKLYEKCGRNSNFKSNEKNRYKKTPNEKDKKLKAIIGSKFYDRQNYLIKSPDVVDKKLSDKKTRESTLKNKEKSRAEDIIMENNENVDQNKMLTNKRQPENEIKRRTTRALAKKQEELAQSKRLLTHSAEKSITDDEVLVYQTPIKTNGIISLGDIKASPGITTRKNLINLFQQIDKSG